MRTRFNPVSLSLADILGAEHVEAAARARAALTGEDGAKLEALGRSKVDFFPEPFQERLAGLLPRVGTAVARGLGRTRRGASTAQFNAHSRAARAPLSGVGSFRIGEDGRLFLISKSEHYHASLGHGFPGYVLVERARALGIPNATHNNTRGSITRLLEEELVRTAAGIARDDRRAIDALLASEEPASLNRVLNLETGSLAAEAAIKMVLHRFYRSQPDYPAGRYRDRIPVLVVLGDDRGGLTANYHGTAMIAQMTRGMWPEMLERLEASEILVVRAVAPNDLAGLEATFATYERGRYKIAGFFHELVMMNYGARRLSEDFVKRAYALCAANDVPAAVDEIQTCIWSPRIYMFREYGLEPSFVVVGKGFTGGEYAASRLLFTVAMDTLPQFGALVTNGQEELASLAYLVTLYWAEANAAVTSAVGERYEGRVRELAARFPGIVREVEGRRHLAGLWFHDLETATEFCRFLNERGLDISVQTYKEGGAPCALTKLPLTAGEEVVDLVVERMEHALEELAAAARAPRA